MSFSREREQNIGRFHRNRPSRPSISHQLELEFALLLGATLYYRRQPREHKSLMFLAVVNLLPSALGRIPPGNPLVALIVPIGVTLVALGLDGTCEPCIGCGLNRRDRRITRRLVLMNTRVAKGRGVAHALPHLRYQRDRT
jgi:hypothetical protein